MVKFGFGKDGATLVHLGRKDWLKLFSLLAVLLYGHFKLQCSRFETLSNNVLELNCKMQATEKSVSELRADCREFIGRLHAAEPNGTH